MQFEYRRVARRSEHGVDDTGSPATKVSPGFFMEEPRSSRLKPEERVHALKIVQGCAYMLPGSCGQISGSHGWVHCCATAEGLTETQCADGEPEVIHHPSKPPPINLRVPACSPNWLRHSRVGARSTTYACWSWHKQSGLVKDPWYLSFGAPPA